ncbi:MAG: hypothetical protein R2874_06730 [Desulfobacterales bacterium]
MSDELLTANIILYCKKWILHRGFLQKRPGSAGTFENDWFVEFTLNAASRLSIADERRVSIPTSSGAGMTSGPGSGGHHHPVGPDGKKRLNPTPVRTHPRECPGILSF